MRLKLPTIWLMFALLGAADSIPVQAALEIEPLFGSGMVVQRNEPIPLWGQVAPGQTVTVQEGVVTKCVVAGADGRWKIVLPARPAGLIPDIVITTGSEKITLTNLLAGDVWQRQRCRNRAKKCRPSAASVVHGRQKSFQCALARFDRAVAGFFGTIGQTIFRRRLFFWS